MCLAIPMQVIEIRGKAEDFLAEQIAVVDADGIRREIRLDIVDRWPEIGDYLIIHAGFAIHTLDACEAEINLKLLREMADRLSQQEEPRNNP